MLKGGQSVQVSSRSPQHSLVGWVQEHTSPSFQ